jgi:hypothetical protein
MGDIKTSETPRAAEPRQAAETPEAAGQPVVAGPQPPSEPTQFTKLGEDIGEAAPSQPSKSPAPAPVSQVPVAEEPWGIGQFWKSVLAMQVSQRTWLVVVTVFVGMAILLIFSFTPRRTVQNKPAESTLESVTPELVTARCGQPAQDVTKDLYPMMTRTMSYKPTGLGSVVVEFTRTSEENSQWLFLSMKDGNGTIKYETAEMQFAALPCLAPKK